MLIERKFIVKVKAMKFGSFSFFQFYDYIIVLNED